MKIGDDVSVIVGDMFNRPKLVDVKVISFDADVVCVFRDMDATDLLDGARPVLFRPHNEVFSDYSLGDAAVEEIKRELRAENPERA